MLRTEVINDIAGAIGAEKYLEIGVRDPHHNFHDVRIADKTGVDPAVDDVVGVLPMTSDSFFAKNDEQYDIIFIDGDHRYWGCKRDLENALTRLTDNGVVIMHDVHPMNEQECLPKKPNNGLPWCGEAWKVFVEARVDGWMGMTVDVDHGVGIVMPQKVNHQISNIEDGINFGIFRQNVREWLNVVTMDRAKRRVTL